METQSHRQIFCHEERFGYWFVPNLRARVMHERGGYLVTTNGSGMRCSREIEPKRPGVRRMLILGDSFTAGDGVDNAERYSDRLEQLVPALEVFNAALPGSGTDQQALVHEAFAEELDPDILVLAPLAENIRRNVAHYRQASDLQTGRPVLVPKPYFTLEDGELLLRNVPVPRALPKDEAPADAVVDRGGRFAAAREAVNRYAPGMKPLLQRLIRYQPHPEYDDATSPARALMEALIRRIFSASRARLKILMPLPYYLHIEELAHANYLAPLRHLALEIGAGFVDVLPAFQALPRALRRECRFPADIHYTPLAHAQVATALSSAL